MPDDDYSKSGTADFRISIALSLEKLTTAKSDPPKRMAKFRDWILEGPKKAGAPKGRWWDTIDAPLRDAMEHKAAETPETENFKPYQVARIVIEETEMLGTEHEAAIRRLVRWWENPDRQN